MVNCKFREGSKCLKHGKPAYASDRWCYWCIKLGMHKDTPLSAKKRRIYKERTQR